MSVYKKFPHSNLIREWDKLIQLNRKEVEIIYEEWKLINEENKELNKKLFNEKHEKLEEISNYLKSVGVDVFKYKKSGFFPQKNGYQSWYKNNVVDVVSKNFPSYSGSMPYAHMMEVEVNGIKLYNNQSPTTIVELYDKIKAQYNSKIRQANKKDKLLIKSIEYAKNNDIDIENLSSKDIIYVVNEHAIEKYLEENYPDGTEVYLKHACDECSTYIVGEHRCSCGNRRISIQVDGDIVEGFDGYPEAN